MTKDGETETPNLGRRLRLPILASFICLPLLGLVLYEMEAHRGKEAGNDPTCAASGALAARLKPFVHGDIAALTLANSSKPLPDFAFSGPEGQKLTLADFRGRDLLLNLWATWCVPCRQEMPALDRVQAELGSANFEVLAINIDTARLERPRSFLNEIGVKSLGYYSDAKADVYQVLKQDGKVLGLPTTILVGTDGCEIGTLAGPAQWDADDGAALLKALKG